MRSRNGIALFIGAALFAAFILTALILQSAYLLYAASVVPILTVPFLPDLPTAQRLKPGKGSSDIRLFRTSAQPGKGFLIIEAQKPGAIQWSKQRLLFSLQHAPVLEGSLGGEPNQAAMSVLAFDLFMSSRKRGVYGIRLNQLRTRLKTLPYTTDEVRRLVIAMEDLAVMDPRIGASIGAAGRTPKGLEA